MVSTTANMHVKLVDILEKLFQLKVKIANKVHSYLQVRNYHFTFIKWLLQQSHNGNLQVSIACPNANNGNKR